MLYLFSKHSDVFFKTTKINKMIIVYVLLVKTCINGTQPFKIIKEVRQMVLANRYTDTDCK